MVLNAVRPSKNILNNFKSNNNMSAYQPCKRGISCPKCSRRRSKEAMENPKARSRKGTLLDAFRKAVNALDELDLVPRAKKARVCRHRPAALTIYVRRRTEKVYNAIRLNQKTVEELEQALGDKYNFAPSCVTSFTLWLSSSSDSCQKHKHERRCIDVTEEMVQKFEDEDDFLLDLNYDIQTGACEIRLTKGTTVPEIKTSQKEEDTEKKKTSNLPAP